MSLQVENDLYVTFEGEGVTPACGIASDSAPPCFMCTAPLSRTRAIAPRVPPTPGAMDPSRAHRGDLQDHASSSSSSNCDALARTSDNAATMACGHALSSPEPERSAVFMGVRPICRPWAMTPLQPLAGSSVAFRTDPRRPGQLGIRWDAAVLQRGTVWVHLVLIFVVVAMYAVAAVRAVITITSRGRSMHAAHAYADDLTGDSIAAANTVVAGPGMAVSETLEGPREAGEGASGDADADDPFGAVMVFWAAWMAQVALADYVRTNLRALRIRIHTQASGLSISRRLGPCGVGPLARFRAAAMWAAGAVRDEHDMHALVGARVRASSLISQNLTCMQYTVYSYVAAFPSQCSVLRCSQITESQCTGCQSNPSVVDMATQKPEILQQCSCVSRLQLWNCLCLEVGPAVVITVHSSDSIRN